VLSSAAGLRQCRVLGTSSKAKVAVKPKLLARRSDEEAQFLEDLATYVIRSGARGRDEVFLFRKLDGTEVPLRSRTIRDDLKKTCEINGLPSAYFSSHSLRKVAVTHMRAAGATEEDRRDRGNYSAGSQVMNQTYDYAVGLGPLASNSLPSAWRLGLRDVKLLIPTARSSL
jgi:integrase